MTKLMQQAMSAIATLSDEHQDELARHLMEEAKRLAIAEGLADVEAGRVISHEDMTAWLESWGTENELPPPACK
ncbi:hypothetical protein [Rhodospirillum sp. A1_3_36]|uniref:hypothetical protein n=1 Tax=Rhodospirillum sp. A1_3_36 TaxID=3391666 RepID=UPI0039A7319B